MATDFLQAYNQFDQSMANRAVQRENLTQTEIMNASTMAARAKEIDLKEKAQIADNVYKVNMMDNATRDLNNRLDLSKQITDQNVMSGQYARDVRQLMASEGIDVLAASKRIAPPQGMWAKTQRDSLDTLGLQDATQSLWKVKTSTALSDAQMQEFDKQKYTDIQGSLPIDEVTAANGDPAALAKIARNAYALQNLPMLQDQVDAIRKADQVNGTNLGDKYPQDVSQMLEPRWNSVRPQYAELLKQDNLVIGKQAVGGAPRGELQKEYQDYGNQLDQLQEQRSTLDEEKDADKIKIIDTQMNELEKKRAAIPIGRSGAGRAGASGMTDKDLSGSIQKNVARLDGNFKQFKEEEGKATTPEGLYQAKLGQYITYLQQKAVQENPDTKRLRISVSATPMEPPVPPDHQTTLDQITAIRNKIKPHIGDSVKSWYDWFDTAADGNEGENILKGMGQDAQVVQYENAKTVKERDTILQKVYQNYLVDGQNEAKRQAGTLAKDVIPQLNMPAEQVDKNTSPFEISKLFSDKSISLKGNTYRLPVTPSDWDMQIVDNGDILWKNKSNKKQVVRMAPVKK